MKCMLNVIQVLSLVDTCCCSVAVETALRNNFKNIKNTKTKGTKVRLSNFLVP